MTLDPLPARPHPDPTRPALARQATALRTSFPLEHHHELGRLMHLSLMLHRGHRHVVVRELDRAAPDCVLPDRAVVLHTVQTEHERRVIAEVDDSAGQRLGAGPRRRRPRRPGRARPRALPARRLSQPDV